MTKKKNTSCCGGTETESGCGCTPKTDNPPSPSAMADKPSTASSCGCSEVKESESSCGCSSEPTTVNSQPSTEPECSCGGPTKEITRFQSFCTSGAIETKAGKIPVVSHALCATDILGNLLVRFGFNRNNYAVKPGLYAIGKPDKDSPVLVSANYKMSFDALRKELNGINAWILVLDTKGVNVWCAAGKGTFGTLELVKRTMLVKLEEIVAHKNLIVPQLGAPGIASHIVKKYAKYKVIYGPVEARDIKTFLDNGMKADEKQRTVEFGLFKRLEVVGIEFVTALQIFLGISLAAVLAASFTKTGFSIQAGLSSASYFIAAMFVTALSATVIPAALLPVLPGRMFSVKGAVAGLVSSVLFILAVPALTPLTKASIVLMSSAISSFVFMNYTGTSTFTSLTGVRKEIAVSAPIMFIAALAGLILQITDFILKGGVKWN